MLHAIFRNTSSPPWRWYVAHRNMYEKCGKYIVIYKYICEISWYVWKELKIVPVHAMKACAGGRVIPPLIRNSGIRSWYVDDFTRRPPLTSGNIPGTRLY